MLLLSITLRVIILQYVCHENMMRVVKEITNGEIQIQVSGFGVSSITESM